jgi:proline dehydrogenase
MFRQVILTVAGNPVVSKTVKRYGLQLGARRFVAGETLDDAVAATRALNREGIMATLDHLGESVRDAAQAGEAARAYGELLDRIQRERLNANVSLKLTMMGLDVDPALGWEHVRAVVERAAGMDNFVRIDMEDSRHTGVTLEWFDKLWTAYPGHVGTVLQAYLYRSLDDLERLSNEPRNFRIVKGAYQERREVAYPVKADVDDNYVRLVETALDRGHYTAVATHDEAVIGRVLRHVAARHVDRERFEFQMLYGINLAALRELAREGYRTRVYIPFGTDWYAYFTRRLAERPANLLFFGRALWSR